MSVMKRDNTGNYFGGNGPNSARIYCYMPPPFSEEQNLHELEQNNIPLYMPNQHANNANIPQTNNNGSEKIQDPCCCNLFNFWWQDL